MSVDNFLSYPTSLYIQESAPQSNSTGLQYILVQIRGSSDKSILGPRDNLPVKMASVWIAAIFSCNIRYESRGDRPETKKYLNNI